MGVSCVPSKRVATHSRSGPGRIGVGIKDLSKGV